MKSINLLNTCILQKSLLQRTNFQLLQVLKMKTSNKRLATFFLTRKVIEKHEIVKSTFYLHNLVSRTSLLEIGTDSLFY